MGKWFHVALLSSIAYGAQASIATTEDICERNGVNLCNIASAMEKNLSTQLPVKINDMVTMESVRASMNSVFIEMRLDEKQGNEFREALGDLGDDAQTIKDIVVERVVRDGCSDENSAQFVGIGGVITYRFLYADGEVFSIAPVASCEITHPVKPRLTSF